MSPVLQPVLILGAGINGAAIARELALAGVPVRVVDRADLASGTTAYSSRLIHGGLRYLEFGEFSLVRESLAERTAWLRQAPQFVRPLRLLIPVERRLGGLWPAMRRFLHWGDPPATTVRGLWTVCIGLQMYDLFARDPTLPRHRVHRANEAGLPAVDRQRYRWLCEFVDAQLISPERFTLALLADAQRIARQQGTLMEVLTYHEATLHDAEAVVQPRDEVHGARSEIRWTPSAIINATGAWVDDTLARIAPREAARPRIAGTSGTHLLSWQPRLRQTLGPYALYGEAPDRRPVFILPFGEATLIGTTDQPYRGNPADARATPAEIEYLLAAVNAMLPSVRLTTDEVDLHYCGVRPLPYTDASSPAAITRKHWLEEHRDGRVPLYSVIGGKLTTCRSLAEQTVDTLMKRWNQPRGETSRGRMLPGEAQLAMHVDATSGSGLLDGASLERAAAAIRDEWVTTLDDLIERRLLLHFDRRLSPGWLRQLAGLLVDAGKLPAAVLDAAIAATQTRMLTHFGRHVKNDALDPSGSPEA